MGGVREFVRYLDRSKNPLIKAPIYIEGVRDGIGIEVAMWWNDSYHETCCRSPTTSPSGTGARISPGSAAR